MASTPRRGGRRGRWPPGILAALLAPFVLNAAVPDSYTPFTVTALAAALLVPAALGLPGRRR